MSKSYGMMVGFDDAIKWVERLHVPDEDVEMKDRTLARLRYERDQNVPVKPKRHKGIHILDYYTCGNCGAGIQVQNKYCPNCGFTIDWRERE